MAQHKPGSLKQKNKKHKGKDGKRAQNKSMGAGKTNGVRKSAKSNALKAVNNKTERLNRNNQLKKIKKDQVWLQKRTGLSSSASCTNTKIVAILALSDRADSAVCLQECLKQMNIVDAPVSTDDSKSTYQAFDVVSKTQFTFVVAPASFRRDVFFALELAKAADILMFPVYSEGSSDMTSVIDEVGLSTLSALKAMGCPDAMFCVDSADASALAMDVGDAHASKKKGASSAHATRKAVHQYIVDTAMLPDARILDLDSSRSNNMLARTLRSMNPKPVTWRSQRSYLLADAASVRVEPMQGQQQPAVGSQEPKYRVQLSGYLRGRPMQVNSLMHLVGVGAGRIVKVWQGQPPSASGNGAPQQPAGDLSAAALTVIHADKEKQDSLQMEAVGNVLMGEQTWPTEEELQMAGMEDAEGEGDRNAGRDRRALKPDQLIPKGMSSYQADWFMDEDGKMEFKQPALDGIGGGNVGAEAGRDEGDGDGDGSSLGDDEEFTIGGGTLSGKKSVAGSRYNSKGELYTLKEREDNYKAFPDEIDTPDDVSARVRFARYRALLSFRASPWHPKENLPADYARIFQFENFGGAQRRLLAESKAVEQMQMHAALNVRNAQRAAGIGGGSVCGSVKSARAGKTGASTEVEVEMEEDEEGSVSDGADSDGEGSGGSESEGEDMEVDADNSKADGKKGARPRLGSTSSTGADPALFSTGITVPEADDFIRAGQYISLELEDVPALVVQRLQQYGFLLCYALYAHEQKMSVLHFHVQKHASYTEPIKSKDELLFMVGFRSFMTKPVFSESNLNCDKHKFERFLQNDTFSMASCYGPIFVSTCPLLVFKRSAGEESGAEGEGKEFRGCGAGWTLVATGSLANVEPDRIMLKKIILTGNPIRVRKKFAVVKHLFYDPQDVRWFKPAELVTKWGLRGHITEPVGTHGLLKAMFSGAIKQNDTVMLILYKRVYPKFPQHGLQIQ